MKFPAFYYLKAMSDIARFVLQFTLRDDNIVFFSSEERQNVR